MSTTIEQGVALVEKSVLRISSKDSLSKGRKRGGVFYLKYLFEIPKSTIFRDDSAQRKNQPF